MAHNDKWAVHVLIGGEWSVDPATNEHRFVGYKRIETILLKEDSKFLEMMNQIVGIMDLGSEITPKLVIEYLPKYLSKISVLPIKNDHHIQCFLNEIIKRGDARIPLCVTIRDGDTTEDEFGASNSPINLSFDCPARTDDVIHTRLIDDSIVCIPAEDPHAGDEGDDPDEGMFISEDEQRVPVGTRQKESNRIVSRNLPTITATQSSHAECGTSSDRLAAVVDVAVKDVFETRRHLFMRMSMLAVKHFFEWKVVRANRQFWYLRCKDKNCSWMLNAAAVGNSSAWKIIKYANNHTCKSSLVQSDHKHASRDVLGSWIKCKYTDVCRPYRPKEIISDIRTEWGVNITYNKAWRVREAALAEVRGSFEDSYRILPSYLHVMNELNLGTVVEVCREEDGCFKYLFFAFGASIRGFQRHMRPVIAVDACFLKGKYPGSLIVATSIDGNNQVYPVGWGIVDSENDASWEWFLERLKIAIGSDVDGLVFVSDRHKSIAKGIANVFPNSFHGACIYHLSNNLKSKFKQEALIPLYFKAVKAYTIAEFNEMFGIISLKNPRVGEYLREVGLERWSRAHSGGRRYTIMTSNIAECLNALLKDACELPIHSLVDYIRNTLQRWFHDRRTAAGEINTMTTPYCEELIGSRMREAQSYVVDPVDMNRWCVRDIANRAATVDLFEKTCMCQVFDMDQLPCVHALAAARRSQIDHYTLCSQFYHTAAIIGAYAEPIMPVGDPKAWIVPEEILSIQLSPPEPRAKSGRPKKKRIPSTGEKKIEKNCGRCGQRGHNRQTCTNQLVCRD